MTCLTDPASLFPDPLSRPPGKISLVGAGPGAADLLTLRAIRCLGQADVVYYDRLVDPEALAFARPGARCIFVGKDIGAHAWPQSRIDAAIVTSALDGLRVVRLKSGDPSIFGRAAEEIAAARTHGIEVEVIPGITAATAAAASLCEPLTERGRTDRVVLATATCRPEDDPAPLTGLVTPGTTLVFYMAMQRLDALCRRLTEAGLPASHPVTVAADVGKPGERSLRSTLSTLSADCRERALGNPALIIVQVCKEPEHTPPATVVPARRDLKVLA